MSEGDDRGRQRHTLGSSRLSPFPSPFALRRFSADPLRSHPHTHRCIRAHNNKKVGSAMRGRRCIFPCHASPSGRPRRLTRPPLCPSAPLPRRVASFVCCFCFPQSCRFLVSSCGRSPSPPWHWSATTPVCCRRRRSGKRISSRTPNTRCAASDSCTPRRPHGAALPLRFVHWLRADRGRLHTCNDPMGRMRCFGRPLFRLRVIGSARRPDLFAHRSAHCVPWCASCCHCN